MGIDKERKRTTPPHRCRGRPGTDASTDADGRGVSMRMDEPPPCGWAVGSLSLPGRDAFQERIPSSEGLKQGRVTSRSFAAQPPAERRDRQAVRQGVGPVRIVDDDLRSVRPARRVDALGSRSS